jgi:hypothetical protein
VRDIVAGSGLRFEERGLHELKGIEGPRRLFVALDAKSERERDAAVDEEDLPVHV